MKYYQIIYTASETGRSGQPGFGIRTATESIPDKLLNMLDHRATTYACGSFPGVSGAKLAENPELVRTYPQTYFYLQSRKETGEKVYLLGRVVYTGFDYPYFKSSNPSTRTGNYVSHVYMFDSAPDPEIFDLLYGCPSSGSAVFRPVDYTPSSDNQEMKALMLGPSVPLPAEEKSFRSSVDNIAPVSFDLLFDLISALTEGKRLVVRMRAVDAPAACAGLMRLLPARYSQDMTFSINHQEEGLNADTKITFINEYYQYQTPAGQVKIVDYINGSHTRSALEKMWRKNLEDCVARHDTERLGTVGLWLFNKLSSRFADKPEDLNMALLRYLYIPDEFTLGDVADAEGLLPVLSKMINADASKASLLESLLDREFQDASEAADYIRLIKISEDVAGAGIALPGVYERAKPKVTGFVMGSPANLMAVLAKYPVSLLKKYLDLNETSRHKDFLSDSLVAPVLEKVYPIFYRTPYPGGEMLDIMVEKNLPEVQMKAALSEICPSSAERVGLYMKRLKSHPDEIGMLKPLLKWDKNESDKVDYTQEFSDRYSDEAYADLFYASIVRRKNTPEIKKTLILCKDIASVNPAFMTLLKNDKSLYETFFGNLVEKLKGNTPKELDSFIGETVLPYVQAGSTAERKWKMLKDIFTPATPQAWSREHYALAASVGNAAYIGATLDKCYENFKSEEDVFAFVRLMKNLEICKARTVLEAASKLKSSHQRGYYLAAVARNEGLEFAKVMDLAEKLRLDEKTSFYETYFKKEYRAMKTKAFFQKITNVFSRKGNKEGDEQ